MIAFYRALLRLYPSSFRAEYGEEMTAAFAQAYADATAVGRIGLVLRIAADEPLNAVAAQWAILIQDLRYTVRTLNRARGFAITAILVTALGVGANTAAFSVADFVLFRPLPFSEPDNLVRLCEGPRTGGGWGCNNQLSPANYRDFKAMTTSFQEMGAFASDAVNLVGGGEPRRIVITPVTPEVLRLLGVRPALGRVFESRADDRSSVVLSHGLWQSQFGGDPAILGRAIRLNGAVFTVIGVMPATFYFPGRDVQMWTALTFQEADFASRSNSYLEAVARLKPGVTFEQARTELLLAADRLGREYPATNAETGISFFLMRDYMSPRTRIMLVSLSGASLCLLLLTCANLANLLLARTAAHERELAVRAALGARRERLVRQLVTESVTLTLLGGAAGLLVAGGIVPLFSSLVPPTLPVASQPHLDLRVLTVAALFTGFTALTFGLLPALRAGAGTAFAALRDGSRGGGRRQRLRAILVTIEVTMSVVLLITSGLLIRAVWRVQAVDPGFTSQSVLTLRTALPRPKYDDPMARGAFYEGVLTRVRSAPGVDSAAFITGLPMVMTGGITSVEIPGQHVRSARAAGVSIRFVTPQFFRAMGIRLIRGRDVEPGDTADRAWIAVVSASFVERYWPGQDPIGKTFVHRGRARTVVGVVGDIRVRGLERSSEPQMYLPALQVAPGIASPNYDAKDLVIRHAGSTEALVGAVRQIIRDVDPEQPISDLRTLDEVLAGDTATRRAQLQVLGVLATVAVLLSGVGIYGLLAYTVAQRSQEIGVRLALGAEPSRVGHMIFADGMRLAVIGIVPGVLGAYAAARGMSALLFGVAPGDPATFVAAVTLALLMTFLGSLVPALRAVRVSPMSVLKVE